jgi:hypothetical protein
MNEIVGPVVAFLSKYVLDQERFLKEAGQSAADIVGQLFKVVTSRLKADRRGAKTVERFEKHPESNARALEAALAGVLATDPVFASRVRDLYSSLLEASPMLVAQSSGSGGVASHGGVAAGAGGAAAGAGGTAIVIHPGDRPTSGRGTR